jgi:tRNA pseudouridine65 synthase
MPGREPVRVIYEDEHLVALDKPAGLISHRSALARYEREFFIDEARALTGRTIYMAHRLDRATSGIVLCAASKEVAAELGRQFMDRGIDKTYLAVTRGHVPDSGAIDAPLDAPHNPEPKPALTRYTRIATVELPIPVPRYETSRYSLIEVVPETGRYQQIRRHLRDVAHPIAGDSAHGDGRHNRSLRIHFGMARMLLHAWLVAFDHPADGRRLRLAAPLDRAFLKMLGVFGWRDALAAHAAGRDATVYPDHADDRATAD